MIPADYFQSLQMEQHLSLSESASNPYSILAEAPENTPDHRPTSRHNKTLPGGLFIKQLRWLVAALAEPDNGNYALLSWRKAEGFLDGVDAFTFHDTKACEEKISHFFSTNKWDSLKRQLNNYGFLRLHDNRARGSTWFHPHFTQEGKTDELIFKKPSSKKTGRVYSLQTLSKSPVATRTTQLMMSSQNTNSVSNRKEAAQGSSSLFALADAAEVISCYGASDVGGGGGPGGGVRDLSVEKRRGGGASISRVVTSSLEDLTQSEFVEDDLFATNEGSPLKKRPRNDDSINETAQQLIGVDDRDGDDTDTKQPKIKVEVEALEVFEVDGKNRKKVPLDVFPSPLKPRAPSCHAANLAGPGRISSSRQQHLHAQHPYQGLQKQVHDVQFPLQRPIHVASAGGGFRGGYPKGVRMHEALQPQPQMPQPRQFQQQPSYNYYQYHQVRPLQAQHYNPQSLYQQQQQQQLPYHFQYPTIMQPPHESTTTWPVAYNNETSGLLQQESGHLSTFSFDPPQSTSATAVMQTTPIPALTTAESNHFQRMYLWEQQQARQQQQVQQQQQQQQARDQISPRY